MELIGIRKVTLRNAPKMVIDNNSGELLELNKLTRSMEIDSLPFIKVYHMGVRALMGLNTSGLRVWGYIVLALRKRQTTFYVCIEDIKDYLGYKTNRDVYRGLKELIKLEMIIPNKDGSYDINPNMFFNGKRIK
jgi:hypothetical protein